MNLVLVKMCVKIDKVIVRIYAKNKSTILKKYLERRHYTHTKAILKSANEIFETGDIEAKKNVIRDLKEIIK